VDDTKLFRVATRVSGRVCIAELNCNKCVFTYLKNTPETMHCHLWAKKPKTCENFKDVELVCAAIEKRKGKYGKSSFVRELPLIMSMLGPDLVFRSR